MAYKDKDRQRAYQRDWVRQKRQGSTDTNWETVTPDEASRRALQSQPNIFQVFTKEKQTSRKGFND